MTFTQLKHGHIIGVIDSYGAVHSHFTGEEVRCHREFWPISHHCEWRWNNSESIWWIMPEKAPAAGEYLAIQDHLTKKYGLTWFDNGHHDWEHLQIMIDRENNL